MWQRHVRAQNMPAVDAGAAAASQDMQRNRHIESLRGGPERIVVAMAIRLVVRRRTPNEYSANTYFTAALEFRYGSRDVAEFDGAETDEPFRTITGVFCRPVVEPAKACGAKLGVVE